MLNNINTQTIYGEAITGKVVITLSNTVIVEDERGERHVVHKDDLGKRHKRVKSYASQRGSFDLAECKRIGKGQHIRVRKGY